MSNGTIASLNSDGSVPFPPGTFIFFSGSSRQAMAGTKILELTQDATYEYVLTPYSSSGFPPFPTTGTTAIQAHPCPKLTFTNCTGCNDALSFSKAQAGAPMYSYSFRTYNQSTPPSNSTLEPTGTAYTIIGKCKQITINVVTPYVGGPLTMTLEINWYGMDSNTIGFYLGIVDLTTAGKRVVMPFSVTGSQSGDSALALPEARTWFTGESHIALSTTPSSPFTATVEILTDQGLTAPPPSSVFSVVTGNAIRRTRMIAT
jgi:hypothetical protein